MSAPGHVFVVHADLTKLACDEYLIPTDVHRQVTGHWRAFGPPGPVPEGWGDDGRRVTEPRELSAEESRWLVRWVNTGSVKGRDPVDWVAEGLRQALAAATSDLRDRAPRYGRARPLLGMPLFGVGEGGFDGVRGKVLAALLAVAQEFARDAAFDIVFVCYRRADYAAMQSRTARLDATASLLSEEHRRAADDLGKKARDGSLVLFLGAGVSVPAGLPGWKDLLAQLAARAEGVDLRTDDLLDAAQAIRSAMGDAAYGKALHEVLHRPQHALGHGLLASLKVRESITTNFDDLYEQAAAVPFAGHFRVLPWERAQAGAWLLKMHGGIKRPHVILTREDYTSFDERWRPVASIVQALLVARYVMFVGFSLEDDNFIRLGTDVSRLLSETTTPDGAVSHREVGSVLTLGPRPELVKRWGGDLRVVAIGEDPAPTPEAGRRLEIFLDRVAASAASEERSYLLDPRYDELLPDQSARELAAELRAIARRLSGAGPAWDQVEDVLEALGAPHQRPAQK